MKKNTLIIDTRVDENQPVLTIEEITKIVRKINSQADSFYSAIYSTDNIEGAKNIYNTYRDKTELTKEQKEDYDFATSFLKAYEEYIASQNKKDEKRPPLPPLKKYGLMNDKVNHQLIEFFGTRQEQDGQLRFVWGVNENSKSKDNQIVTYIYMTSENLTATQNSIVSAMGTCFFNWRKNNTNGMWISVNEIWRAMNGKTNMESPSKNQKEAILREIDFMRTNLMKVDFTQLLASNRINLDEFKDDRVTSGVLEDTIINAIKGTFKTDNGRTSEGYFIEHLPLIYMYNMMLNHLILVDYKLLEVPGSGEDNVIEFRDYLLMEIYKYKTKSGRDSNKILLSTMYERTRIKLPEERINRASYKDDRAVQQGISKIRRSDITKITNILTSFKEKGFIKDFKEDKAGNKTIGFIFTCDREKKQAISEK